MVQGEESEKGRSGLAGSGWVRGLSPSCTRIQSLGTGGDLGLMEANPVKQDPNLPDPAPLVPKQFVSWLLKQGIPLKLPLIPSQDMVQAVEVGSVGDGRGSLGTPQLLFI